jgi:hypothetical protein
VNPEERERDGLTFEDATRFFRTLDVLDLWSRLDDICGFCRCPCCGAYDKCVDECTFAVDCPKMFADMAAVRRILFSPTMDVAAMLNAALGPEEGE